MSRESRVVRVTTAWTTNDDGAGCRAIGKRIERGVGVDGKTTASD